MKPEYFKAAGLGIIAGWAITADVVLFLGIVLLFIALIVETLEGGEDD